MTGVWVAFDPTGSTDGLRSAVGRLIASGAQSFEVLACVHNELDWDGAIDGLVTNGARRIFGGLFPGVIHDGSVHTARGTVVIGYEEASQIHVIDPRGERLSASEAAWPIGVANTFHVYLDASFCSAHHFDVLLHDYGGRASWIGGGCGAGDFGPRRAVITPLGLMSGVTVIAGFAGATRVVVADGWTGPGPDVTVTNAVERQIRTMAWRPALDVYREMVEAMLGEPFPLDSFQRIASRYPLLLEADSGSAVVRDPIDFLADGTLRCAGDVPPYSAVRLASCTPDVLLEACRVARDRLVASLRPPMGRVALTVDCVSRLTLFGSSFDNDLAALQIPGHVQAGALTIGEIAAGPGTLVRLRNKCAAVAVRSS